MEVLDAENGDSKNKIVQIDFEKVINGIETQCERSLLTRKNQMMQKQQQKQNWLSKTKIIPPSFPKFQENAASINSLKPSSFYENMFSNNGSDKKCIDNGEMILRNQCKTSYGNVRNVSSCKRIKSSWKLQFRKDELNVLRYKYTRNQEENTEPQTTGKGFKIRKVFKKLEDGRTDFYYNSKAFYDVNEDKSNNYRERLKTSQAQGPYRRRYLAG